MARKDKKEKVSVVLQEQKLLGTGGVDGEPAGMWSKEVWARKEKELPKKTPAAAGSAGNSAAPSNNLPTPAALSAAIAEFTKIKKSAPSLSELKKEMLAKKRGKTDVQVEVFAPKLEIDQTKLASEAPHEADLGSNIYGEYPHRPVPQIPSDEPVVDDELMLAKSEDIH